MQPRQCEGLLSSSTTPSGHDRTHLPVVQPIPAYHSGTTKLLKHFQFIDNNDVSSGPRSSTQIRSHVMREYVRQKRWRERERLQASSPEISTSRVKRPIQRLKPEMAFAHVRGAPRPASSIEMRNARKPEGKEPKSGITKQHDVSVDSAKGRDEAVDCRAARGTGSLDGMGMSEPDKDVGGQEKFVLEVNKDVERTPL